MKPQAQALAPYSVTMDLRRVGDVTFTIWGRDRKDVMEFVKTHYRRHLKGVKSCTSREKIVLDIPVTSGGNDGVQ